MRLIVCVVVMIHQCYCDEQKCAFDVLDFRNLVAYRFVGMTTCYLINGALLIRKLTGLLGVETMSELISNK